MDIATKLSWEIVGMNDHGGYSTQQYTAAEVAYGVALQVGDQPELFSAVMSSIIGQITDEEVQQAMRQYTARGLKK